MAKRVTKLEKGLSLPERIDNFDSNIMRVAAYVRVSTNHEEQHMSLLAQADYYEKEIAKNPQWLFAGIYADDGHSGTSYRNRDGFNQMIQDCHDGKITMIVTKSVSRFARNTVDSINVIRELKALGIGVLFERENIWTLDSGGEFLLTVMSSLAQEESRSISENVTWGQRKKMSDGRYSLCYSRFLGYDKGRNGEPVLNDQQAVTIRRIFALFLQGYSAGGIAGKLTDEGFITPTGLPVWRDSTVLGILQNEKYKGCALLQKTFSSDFLTKKRKSNRGELPQYFVKDGHEAIIEPELFDHIQELLHSRRSDHHAFSGRSYYAGKIRCSVCGNYYGTKPWHSVDTVWVCRERSKTGHSCDNTHIYDYAFQYHLKQVMIMRLLENPTILQQWDDLMNRFVSGSNRKKAANAFLHHLKDCDLENLDLGEEPAYIIERIIVFPDDLIEVQSIDGIIETVRLRRYSAKRGWWPERPYTNTSKYQKRRRSL